MSRINYFDKAIFRNLKFAKSATKYILIRMKNCKSCHTERECRNCHTAKGVNIRSKIFTNPHPYGWVNRISPNFHKRRARIRLSSCTSCHTKNDCSYCHIKKIR